MFLAGSDRSRGDKSEEATHKHTHRHTDGLGEFYSTQSDEIIVPAQFVSESHMRKTLLHWLLSELAHINMQDILTS